MPDNAFTEAEVAELVRLLRKVAANGYFWPTEEVMRAAHGVVSCWTTEIVVLQKEKDAGLADSKILFTRYEGGIEKFKGMWHIPGGYNKWPQADVQETASAISKRELGFDVTVRRVLDAWKWSTGEHPYGRPMLLYVLSEPHGSVVETDKMKFFGKDDLPLEIVPPHLKFATELFAGRFSV